MPLNWKTPTTCFCVMATWLYSLYNYILLIMLLLRHAVIYWQIDNCKSTHKKVTFRPFSFQREKAWDRYFLVQISCQRILCQRIPEGSLYAVALSLLLSHIESQISFSHRDWQALFSGLIQNEVTVVKWRWEASIFLQRIRNVSIYSANCVS